MIPCAILSAGLSLMQTWPTSRLARSAIKVPTIAVNSALARFDCDWLAAGDGSTLLRLGDVRPRVGVVTHPDVVQTPPPGWHDLQRLDCTQLPALQQLAVPPEWSIQYALALGHHLGADELHVFGHDAKPGPDVAGNDGEDRTPERWRREERCLHASVDRLRDLGVAVWFHQHLDGMHFSILATPTQTINHMVITHA